MTFKHTARWLLAWLVLTAAPVFAAHTNPPAATSMAKVFILPIREDILPPMVYLVRRGVKEAMEAQADALILDMKTDGGRVDVTEEIIEILGKFKGLTVTYVNNRAFSAGAFISIATQKIFMAPQSVIGAAAPIMMSPGGTGVEKMPDTVEIKMTSAIRAIVRVQAEKNGHDIGVIEAMIDKTKELRIDGEVLNKEGNILTLTDRQAAQEYGNPPRALLSSGTMDSIDALLVKLGYAGARRIEIKPTGAEQLGTWITAISPLLLIAGIVGLYIEFKTPGFGLPGIVGIAAFALYFMGGYVAGLSGAGWAIVFVLGLILLALDLFVLPGTFVPGIAGAVLMLIAIVMGMVDTYPGAPTIPTFPQLRLPLRDLGMAALFSLGLVLILARYLPRTRLFNQLISQSASGVLSVAAVEEHQKALLGRTGVAVSPLCPGGKARFGDELVDVITRGEMVEKARRVRVIGHSGQNAVVEDVG